MRLPLATLATFALAGSALAFPFKLPYFFGDHERPSTEPYFNVAPLLSSLEAKVIPDRYIVVLKENLPREDVHAHRLWVSQETEHYGAQSRDLLGDFFQGVKRHFSLDGVVHGYSGHFDKQTVEKIRQSPHVAYVEKDQIVHAWDVERDVPSWGLSRVSHRELPSPEEYKEYEYDSHAGSGVVAYIIDTGVHVTHKDFEGRAVWGKTIPENDEDEDGNGHGTHVAGTVGGKTFGIAKKVQIKAVKVLSSNGSGTLSDVIAGIEWAITDHQERVAEARRLASEEDGETDPSTNKKKKPTPPPEDPPTDPAPKPDPGKKVKSVANMSLGGGRSKTLDRAVDAAVEAGIHFAVAAGNDARDACLYSPAASKQAVTVGASTVDDKIAWFSNHGKCLDVFAPGRDITSSWTGSDVATNTISGTSMASPHVCGLLALLLSEPEHEDLTPSEMKDLIKNLSTAGVIDGIPTWSRQTPNKLIYNDPPSTRKGKSSM